VADLPDAVDEQPKRGKDEPVAAACHRPVQLAEHGGEALWGAGRGGLHSVTLVFLPVSGQQE